MANQETVADIIAEMRGGPIPQHRHDRVLLRHYADRLEAAHKRERESITPKPDPDWKGICAKCKDGDIEPKHCEYYGDPNGCNSPIYGEHPTAKKSLVVGNAAKLRDALMEIRMAMMKDSGMGPATEMHNTIDAITQAALAAPPRNCDVGTVEEQYSRMFWECHNRKCMDCKLCDKRMCALSWAQKPYKEGGAK